MHLLQNLVRSCRTIQIEWQFFHVSSIYRSIAAILPFNDLSMDQVMFVRQIPMTVDKLKLFNKILLKEDFPISLDRSSRPEVFHKKAVLKAFLKFT